MSRRRRVDPGKVTSALYEWVVMRRREGYERAAHAKSTEPNSWHKPTGPIAMNGWEIGRPDLTRLTLYPDGSVITDSEEGGDTALTGRNETVADFFLDRFENGAGDVDPNQYKTVRMSEREAKDDSLEMNDQPEQQEKIPEALRLLTNQKPGVYEVGGTTFDFPEGQNSDDDRPGSWDSFGKDWF